jgi:hypothetical protein
MVRLRGPCTPPEQGPSVQWPTIVSVQVVSIYLIAFGQPTAIMDGMVIGPGIVTAGLSDTC